MKNENQHFSADRRKFGRHFWIGAAVAGALSAAVIFTAASAVYRKNRFDLKIGEEKVGSKEYQLCLLEVQRKNSEAINTDTIMVHVRNIREKIEIDPKNPKYLKVVWGVG